MEPFSTKGHPFPHYSLLLEMGSKRKHSFSDDVSHNRSGFPPCEDELAVEVMRLRCVLADIESYAHCQADQANYFYKSNVTIDMEKVELEAEIGDLRSRNEAL